MLAQQAPGHSRCANDKNGPDDQQHEKPHAIRTGQGHQPKHNPTHNGPGIPAPKSVAAPHILKLFIQWKRDLEPIKPIGKKGEQKCVEGFGKQPPIIEEETSVDGRDQASHESNIPVEKITCKKINKDAWARTKETVKEPSIPGILTCHGKDARHDKWPQRRAAHGWMEVIVTITMLGQHVPGDLIIQKSIIDRMIPLRNRDIVEQTHQQSDTEHA